MGRNISLSRKVRNDECEHCGSKNGHWDVKNLWHCTDCDRITAYYEVTEKGKEVLRIILGEPNNLSEETKK